MRFIIVRSTPTSYLEPEIRIEAANLAQAKRIATREHAEEYRIECRVYDDQVIVMHNLPCHPLWCTSFVREIFTQAFA